MFSANAEGFEYEIPDSDEILDVKFLSRQEIRSYGMRMPFTEEVLERYENERNLPLETVEDFRN